MYATSYDLRAYDGPIRDQQTLGACTAFATTAVVDTVMREAGHTLPMLSTLAFYGEERDYLHYYNYDIGANGAAMEYASTQKGFVTETAWPYDPANMAVRPPADVTAQESLNHATSWTFIDGAADSVWMMVQSVKQSLSEGKPLQLLFTPQSGFYYEHGPLNTLVGMSQHDETAKHDVEIIGCNDTLDGGVFIVHNSWNTSWGDNGYGVISYNEFTPNTSYSEIQGFYELNGFVSNGATYDFTYSKERVAVNTEYATILGRAADVPGLDYWAGVVKTGAPLTVLANQLISSGEGAAIYGAMNDTQFLAAVYHSVLNRDADPSGLAFWSGVLAQGVSRGEVFSDFISSVQQPGAEAHDYMTNKASLADYISIALQYDGNASAASAIHNVMQQVTADPNQVEILKVGLADIVHGVTQPL